MKKTAKKFAAFIAAASVMIGSGTTQTFAGSSAQYNLGGAVIHASVTTGSDSATAETWTGYNGPYMTVSVTLRYQFGASYYRESNTGTPVTGVGNAAATRIASRRPCVVLGAKGQHTASYNGGSWSTTTTVGEP